MTSNTRIRNGVHRPIVLVHTSAIDRVRPGERPARFPTGRRVLAAGRGHRGTCCPFLYQCPLLVILRQVFLRLIWWGQLVRRRQQRVPLEFAAECDAAFSELMV